MNSSASSSARSTPTRGSASMSAGAFENALARPFVRTGREPIDAAAPGASLPLPSPRRSLRSSQSSPACRATLAGNTVEHVVARHGGAPLLKPDNRVAPATAGALRAAAIVTPASIGSQMRAKRNFGRAIAAPGDRLARCRSRCRARRTSMPSTKTTWRESHLPFPLPDQTVANPITPVTAA